MVFNQQLPPSKVSTLKFHSLKQPYQLRELFKKTKTHQDNY